MTVVDAGVVVDLLASPDRQRQAELFAELPDPSTPWLAPDVLTFEVFSALRRHVLRKALSPADAWIRLEQLDGLPIDFVSTPALLRGAWELRDNVSAADALYVALALHTGAELLTTDRRLAQAAIAAGARVRLP